MSGSRHFNTPLMKAVEAYIQKDRSRFHMPGHKGGGVLPVCEAAEWDVTEIPGTDSLYEASGPIAETEARYTALYGSAGTFLSAGGSTLCIQAMLALAATEGAKVLCARGVHTAAVNAMALLGLTPVWMWPEVDGATGLPYPLSSAQVEAALAAHPDAAAVYLTSPNYFGTLCDIAAIGIVCHTRNVPLLVDNAHGAHLRFLEPDCHPVTQGADLCCDSLHKTLPVLTGGALLHINHSRYLADAKRKMSLFGSTSPSYLILLSIDAALDYLEPEAWEHTPNARADLAETAQHIAALERLALEQGYQLPPGPRDPCRLSLGFAHTGLPAAGFRAHLERCGVEPEYLSESFCVFLAGGETLSRDYKRLEQVIATAPRSRGGKPPPEMPPQHPEQAMPLREAVLAASEAAPTEKAEGRVCAGIVSPCPPGIPLALPGERLCKNLCARLKKYGIQSVNVVK